MAYCTYDDLKTRIGEQILRDLTDDADLGAVSQKVVAEAIADADAVIDPFLMGRFDTPLAPVPPIIKLISTDLAEFNLNRHRFKKEVPPAMVKQEERAMKLLAQISEGKVMLAKVTTPTATVLAATRANERTLLFGPDTLKMY